MNNGHVTNEMRGYAGGARTATEQSIGPPTGTVPEVRMALEAHEKRLAHLMSLVDTLEQRMEPVLLPTPPSNMGSTLDRAHDFHTQIAVAIDNHSRGVDDVCTRLSLLIQRIGV